MNPTTKRALPPLIVFSLVLLLGVVGCSKSGKVSGKVTYDGKDVPVGIITFHPEKGRAVFAQIDNGQYTVDKVPAGSVTVTVDTSEARKEYEALKKQKDKGAGGVFAQPGGGGGTAPGMKSTKDSVKMPGIDKEEVEKENERKLAKLKDMVDVPAKFASAETSGLKYEVKSGTNEIDIDIPKGK